MNEFEAPGLPGNWLNGWLAAIGVCVLLPDVRLSFRAKGGYAVFHCEAPDEFPQCLSDALASQTPTAYAIAKNHPDVAHDFPRKVTDAHFSPRAALARESGDPTLGLSVTDLARDENDYLEHSPFDPSAPKGLTLCDRVADCLANSVGTPELIERSLSGRGVRAKINGLGFDYRRVLAPTDPTEGKFADPVIETLAFFGLCLFPLRGNGTLPAPRGWTGRKGARGAFRYPLWSAPLTGAAIDALFDSYWSTDKYSWECITAECQTVPYRSLGTADPTRGYATEPAANQSRSRRSSTSVTARGKAH